MYRKLASPTKGFQAGYATLVAFEDHKRLKIQVKPYSDNCADFDHLQATISPGMMCYGKYPWESEGQGPYAGLREIMFKHLPKNVLIVKFPSSSLYSLGTYVKECDAALGQEEYNIMYS